MTHSKQCRSHVWLHVLVIQTHDLNQVLKGGNYHLYRHNMTAGVTEREREREREGERERERERERGREREREGEREGGREREREGGRERGREGGRERGREGEREREREREGRREGGTYRHIWTLCSLTYYLHYKVTLRLKG